ncbi:GNAT family N-acetyltransferase [Streptomyces sp. ME01-24h]|nr:GNAT family N-acetyltransferase [Streptomyces sp. ME19-03-3]MDX3356758.1 GNAT family N-acetyltransferase [Streptomyces sp. ME01-24h]
MSNSPTPTTVTRPARPADLPHLLRWERDYIRTVEPAAEAGWTEAIDRNLALWVDCLDRTLVLEADGEPGGSTMWMPSDGKAMLIGIHVVPALRRRGFGRLLLDTFAAQARAAGHATLALGVHRANPALHLYEGAGYRRTGEDGDYVLMERPTTS